MCASESVCWLLKAGSVTAFPGALCAIPSDIDSWAPTPCIANGPNTMPKMAVSASTQSRASGVFRCPCPACEERVVAAGSAGANHCVHASVRRLLVIGDIIGT